MRLGQAGGCSWSESAFVNNQGAMAASGNTSAGNTKNPSSAVVSSCCSLIAKTEVKGGKKPFRSSDIHKNAYGIPPWITESLFL